MSLEPEKTPHTAPEAQSPAQPVGIEQQDMPIPDVLPETQTDPLGQEAESATHTAEKEKLIAEFKTETDSTLKLQKLEDLITSGTLSVKEIQGLQQEINNSLPKPKEPGFLERLGAKPYNALGIESVSTTVKTLTGAGIIAGGVYAGYHAIKGLWKWRNGGPEAEKKGSEEEKNKPTREKVRDGAKQLVKRGLIASAGVYIVSMLAGGKGLGEIRQDIKNSLKSLFGKSEDKPGSTGGEDKEVAGDSKGAIKDNRSEFLKLPETEQQVYNEWGIHANTRGENAGLSEDIFGEDMELSATIKNPDETENTINMIGLPAFILNAKHNTVDQLLSERTIYREMMQSTDIVRFVSQLKGYLGEATSWISDLFQSVKNRVIPSDCFDASGVIVEDKFAAYLTANPDAHKLLLIYIKKSLLTISYLNSRKRAYTYHLIAEKCKKDDPAFSTLSAKEQNKKVTELFSNEEYMTGFTPQIEAFDKLPLFKAITLLQETGSLNGDIDKITQAGIDEIEEEKNNFLEIDPLEGDTINCFKDIKEKLTQKEKLTKEEKELLLDKSSELLAIVKDFGETDWIMAHFGPVADLLGRDWGAAKNDILESMGYNEQVLNPLQTFITNFQEAVRNDTLELSHLTELENASNDFFEYKKGIVLNANEFADIKYHDDGSRELTFVKLTKVVRNTAKTVGGFIKDAVVSGGKECATGLVMLRKGDVLEKVEGGRHVFKGMTVGSTGLLAGGWMLQRLKPILSSGSLSVLPKLGDLSVKIGRQGIKPATWLAEEILRRSGMMPKIPYLRTGYYNNFDLLKVDLARGRMTIDEAAKIALQNKLFTAANPNDIEAVRQLFISHLVNKKGMYPGDLARIDELIKQYPHIKSFHRKIFNLDRKRWQFRAKSMGIRINREFMEVIEHVHSRKFSPHLFETLFRKEDFIKLVTKYSSHLKSTEDVVLLSKHLSELQKAGKLDTQNAKVILDNLGKGRAKYKSMTSADLVAKFDNLKLATNLETRLTEATKKAVDSLKDLTNKLRRYRFRSPQVASTLDDIADATATLENPSAVEAMNSGVGPEVSQIGNSLGAESKAALKGLTTMIESDKTLAQALSKASTPDAVKAILQERNITNISDDVIETLAKTSNGKVVGNRILDKVKYLANFEELGRFQRFLQHPSTKVVGKVLGKFMVVGGVALGVYEWIQANTEAATVEGENYQLANEIREEGLAHGVGMGVGGTLIGAGLTMARNPGGRVIMAVGGLTIGADLLMTNYYASKKARAYNKSQFLKSGQGVTDNFILENIFYPDSTRESLLKKFKEANIDDVDHQLISQTSDGIDAKILLTIYKRHPLASISGELGTDDDTIERLATERGQTPAAVRSIILAEKDIASQLYDKAKEYIKQKSGTATGASNGGINEQGRTKEYSIVQNLIGNEKDPAKVMVIINAEVGRSLLYAQQQSRAEGEESLTSNFDSIQSIDTILKQADSIEKTNKKLFETMEDLYRYQPYQFLVIAHKATATGSEKMQRLRNYLQRKQASTGIGLDMMSINYAFDSTEIAQMPFDIERFLEERNASQTMTFSREVFASADPESRDEVCIEDEEITMKYHISENPIDTTMYRYATEVLGIGNFHLSNNAADNDAEFASHFPVSNSRQNGVYRENGKWRFNYDRERNPFDADVEITDLNTLLTHLNEHYQQTFNSDKSGVDENPVDTYKAESLKKIASEEKRYGDHQQESIKEAIAYLKKHTSSSREFIALPLPFITKLARGGIWGIGKFVYSRNSATNEIEKMDKTGKIITGRSDGFHKKTVTAWKAPAPDTDTSPLRSGQGHDRFDGGK